MSDEVKILDGNTFVVSDATGDVEASSTDPTGLFSFDTRFLSKWVLTVNGERLNSLSVDDLQYFEARFFLVPGSATVYVDAKLSVIRERAVGGGFHEELTVMNHGDEAVDLETSDFADLFEVKDALEKKGEYFTRVEDGKLVLGYRRETFVRETWISASEACAIDECGLTFAVHVEPHGQWTTDLDVALGRGVRGTSAERPKYGRKAKKARPTWSSASNDGSTRPRAWTATGTRSSRPTGAASSISRRCVSRRWRARRLAGRRGLPWFMAMFGRDSIFTSHAGAPVRTRPRAHHAARPGDLAGAAVATTSATPTRAGSCTSCASAAAAPAFGERPRLAVLRLGRRDAALRRCCSMSTSGGPADTRKRCGGCEGVARAALEWVDATAISSGDRYVAYRTGAIEATGLENQCWKDSWDSISYRDGRLPGSRARPANSRGTPTTPRCAAPVWRATCGATPPTPNGSRRRRRRSSGASTATSGSPTASTTPWPWTRTAAKSTPWPRTSVTCCGAASSTSPRRRPSPGTSCRRRCSAGGVSDARRGTGALQPDRLSRRYGLAVRLFVHRLGLEAVRLQRGGGAHRRRHPRRGPVLRRLPARGVRRLRARVHQVPGAVPDGVQPAGLVDGHSAAALADDARSRAER